MFRRWTGAVATKPMTRSERGLGIAFAPADRLAIIAGNGRLPVDLAQNVAAGGHQPFLVIIEGEVEPSSPLMAFEHEKLVLEQVSELIPLLKRRKISHAVLAGGIERRPDWRAIRPTLSFFKFLPKLIAALRRGDDGVLRALVRAIESAGIKVMGAHEIVPDLLASAGPMTRTLPLKSDWRDIDAAIEAARAIGRLDIGQAAVAVGGRAVALEGIEGTDGLLQRMRALRPHGRIAGVTRGVLAKCAKPGQELRADLPAIGPATVEAAHAAGLAGIAVEADRSLVLESSKVIERADELGLFVIGIKDAGEPT